MSHSKTVLVTGATGFIGKATVRALRNAGWEVTRGVRSADPSDDVLRVDLADPQAILALGENHRFGAIVHLGALVDLSGRRGLEAYVPNVLSTGCLAHLASIWNAQIVFASTAIVHGEKASAIDSNSPVRVDTPYAKSKWLGELLVEASEARSCILRMAGVFGASGPAHLGLNRAIDAAIQGIAPTQIGSGNALRNYIYVDDVAESIVHVLQQGLQGTHLVSGHETLSIADLLRNICHVFLPGQRPLVKSGSDATDQVIEPSSLLPRTRKFREALADLSKGLPA
jgi:UDP-glucose 4-epimerase